MLGNPAKELMKIMASVGLGSELRSCQGAGDQWYPERPHEDAPDQYFRHFNATDLEIENASAILRRQDREF